VRWWKSATLANQPYLAASPREPTRYDASAVQWREDIRDDLSWCQASVERLGLELLVLDQTRPDTGLSVVKVIVPGLRHFWARFAPGRLYDVPPRLGWIDEPLAEAELNPIPIFI
jgi:ribosomal protein S12 methylthiotransferase accessory factor